MIKVSLVFINFISLLFWGLYSDQEIHIENNIPPTLMQGQRQEVQLVVTKGEIQGFSKLELSLPHGLVASPGDIKGASFTFSGQKARFVWMTLPTEENFTITYFIESAINMEGDYGVTGNFSYVKDNKREDIGIPEKKVLVKKELSPTPEEIARTMPDLKVEAPVVDMICERTITKVSDTEYTITLQVTHNAIKGMFGKILETVPAACNTSAVNDGGATVTQQGNTIKFTWFEAPEADVFECTYKISCTAATPDPSITGVFSYVMDGNPYDLPVIAKGGVPAEATVHTPVNTKVDPVTQPEPANTTETANNTTNKTKEEPVEKTVTNVPSPEVGITYKVQILAAHRVVNKSFLKKTYSFEESFNIENHEGWIKYTTGKYVEYGDARNAREQMKTNYRTLPGPFVTAYNDGERITVQEALLISQQQWMK